MRDFNVILMFRLIEYRLIDFIRIDFHSNHHKIVYMQVNRAESFQTVQSCVRIGVVYWIAKFWHIFERCFSILRVRYPIDVRTSLWLNVTLAKLHSIIPIKDRRYIVL